MITVTRYHDFSCGHRVVGHEGKCQHLHGHNYRIHFTIALGGQEQLDSVGRVMDFGVIKSILCQWLEDNWDHRMLLWTQDDMLEMIQKVDPSVVEVPFNPTAENMAVYLVEFVGPTVLRNTGCYLKKVVIEETRKCSCTYEKGNQ